MNKTFQGVPCKAQERVSVRSDFSLCTEKKGRTLSMIAVVISSLTAASTVSAASDYIANNTNVSGTYRYARSIQGKDVIVGNENSAFVINFHGEKAEPAAINVRRYTVWKKQKGSHMTINGRSLIVDAGPSSYKATNGMAIGIYVATANRNINKEDDRASMLVINSKNTALSVKAEKKLGDEGITSAQAIGIAAMSWGEVYINGNIKIDAEDVILSRGKAVVQINDSKSKTVQLTGNVDFNFDAKTSGTPVDSTVKINLSDKDSYWIGRSYVTDDATGLVPIPNDQPNFQVGQNTSGFVLGISERASWTVTGSSFVNALTLNNGVINIQNPETEVTVDKLAGDGGTLNVVAKTEDGKTLATGKLEVAQLEEGATPNLNVALKGITADDITDTKAAVETAKDAVTGNGSSSINKKIEIAEGAVNGAITADVTGDKVSTVTQSENTKLSAFNAVTAMATMAWRHDMNDLTKRMGELRTSPEGIGSWVRLYGSEQEYGRQNVTSKSTSVQVGSDIDVGYGWKTGGAFTYTDGSSDYTNGSSDNKAFGLAAYGSWLHENGAFVDVIAKYGRLKSDFDLGSMSGTAKNNAYSASAEFGWYVPFANAAFVEPQAEITYGVVKGDDFTTSNGVAISQKDTKAFIGRLGVRTGLHFNENKGVVYARASVLRDFKGESEFTASLVNDSSVRSTVRDDIGGTYYEMGIGANYKFADNAYTYVDFERQNGGDVKEKWRWNVGFRYVW